MGTLSAIEARRAVKHYDSCPMDGFDYDAVAKLIRLPADHAVAMFVVVGRGTKEAWPRPGQLPIDEVVVTDRF